MIKASYAKINLALNVVNKTKPKGMHDLDMLNVTINLKDHIIMNFKADGKKDIFMTCSDDNIPTDSRNFIYKTINKFQKNFNITDTISVHLEKKIPIEAGLGGGSGNAATTLDMLNKHYRTNMTMQQRMKFLEDISSDAPFMEVGQFSRVKGVGNKVEPLNINLKYKVFVVKPNSGCNTKEIYSNIDYKNLKHFNINKALYALENNDLAGFASVAGNSLLDSALNNNLEIVDILSRLKACQFDYVAMSGSGSACFGISKSNRPFKVAKKLFNKANYALIGTYSIKNYSL